MNKIAKYLNEHTIGEVIVGKRDLSALSIDGGVLSVEPEIAVNPANTSDIRKIMRFCWQLAEKGHTLPVVARGYGRNEMSSAIGSGVVLSQNRYMTGVVGVDIKQRLIHVQAGASHEGVSAALLTHRGLTLPRSIYGETDGTIGGVIASDPTSTLARRYGTIGGSVQQLEVVLASGELLQTIRLSKRELSQRKGLHTFEGEIYRQIDNLITDNQDLIQSIGSRAAHNTTGYSSISKVRRKDGSFDLTPLFIGSQGTLGIISEVILKASFIRREFSMVVAAYKSVDQAREAADIAAKSKAVSIELLDGRLVERAATQGKKKDYAPKEVYRGAILVVLQDDFNVKARKKASRKLVRELEKPGVALNISNLTRNEAELSELRSLLSVANRSTTGSEVVPGVFGGIWLSAVKLDNFLTDLSKLEKSFGVQMPFKADMRNGFIDFYPMFDMKKVNDRQNMLKMVAELSLLVGKYDGSMSGRGGDGRVKMAVGQKHISDEEIELYSQIKKIFDPYNILNPGVKHPMPTKELVSQLNTWCRLV